MTPRPGHRIHRGSIEEVSLGSAVTAAAPAAARIPGPLRIGLLALLLGGLVLLVPVVPNFERTVLTIVMVAIMLGYLVLRHHRGRLDYFEIFIPFSVVYLLGFGFSAILMGYFPELAYRRSMLPHITAALAVGVVGYASFAIGYAVSARRTRPSRLERYRVRNVLAVLVPGLVGFLGFMARVLYDRTAIATGKLSVVLSPLHQMAPIFFFAWFLAWYLWFKRRRAVDALMIGLLAPMAATILALTVGGKQLAITVVGFPVLSYWFARRRLPLRTITGLLLLLIFVVFPIYNTYRWTDRALPTSERMARTMSIMSRWDPNTYVNRTLFAAAGRVATITSTAAVVRDVPRWVDYKYGETLILAPISILIPRFLWPDKPSITIGREFGITFGLVNPDDRTTQIASSWVGELYWNFNLPGVILGMFLIGTVYRWVYRKFGEGEGDQPVRWSYYAVMLTAMMQAEGDLAANVATVVKLMLVLWALVALLRWLGAVDEAPRPVTGA